MEAMSSPVSESDMSKMDVRWRCEACRIESKLEIELSGPQFVMFEWIKEAHGKLSPGCILTRAETRAGRELFRLERTTVVMYDKTPDCKYDGYDGKYNTNHG